MNNSSQFKILKETILSDHSVYLWFYFLLMNSSLKKELKSCVCADFLYHRLSRIVFLKRLFIIIAIMSLSLGFVFNQPDNALVAALFLLGYGACLYFQRALVVKLSLECIALFFPNLDLNHKTLYEIAQELGLKYNLPGLAGSLAKQDDFALLVLAIGVITFQIILPIQLSASFKFLLLIGFYFCGVFLFKPAFYQQPRKSKTKL